ncbi:restriction endonuclease [Enterococcus sp. BWR-S5]|uniref:restriction endonuclease n=1 Tax=Enterococcus sp. BWR-S5 TaxID=2787714 RepID=UPI0019247ED7|nr:restriction endonuclease [Enterococcus sp. BWR-S5]MBL1225859.1 restriction endonuclease [Enterococcus sp. BWR-S5]
MFNYASLNDVEFEELCRDVMQRKLNLELRTYSSGKDGGIDFADDEFPHKVIVQVKHFG